MYFCTPKTNGFGHEAQSKKKFTTGLGSSKKPLTFAPRRESTGFTAQQIHRVATTESCHWELEIRIRCYLCTPNNTNRVFFAANETNEAKQTSSFSCQVKNFCLPLHSQSQEQELNASKTG